MYGEIYTAAADPLEMSVVADDRDGVSSLGSETLNNPSSVGKWDVRFDSTNLSNMPLTVAEDEVLFCQLTPQTGANAGLTAVTHLIVEYARP